MMRHLLLSMVAAAAFITTGMTLPDLSIAQDAVDNGLETDRPVKQGRHNIDAGIRNLRDSVRDSGEVDRDRYARRRVSGENDQTDRWNRNPRENDGQIQRRHGRDHGKYVTSHSGRSYNHGKSFGQHRASRHDHRQHLRSHQGFQRDHKRYYSRKPVPRHKHFAKHHRLGPQAKHHRTGGWAKAYRR